MVPSSIRGGVNRPTPFFPNPAGVCPLIVTTRPVGQPSAQELRILAFWASNSASVRMPSEWSSPAASTG